MIYRIRSFIAILIILLGIFHLLFLAGAKQLINKNYPYNHPGLEMAGWGSLAFTVLDPFGNQLLFTEHKGN